MLRRLLEWLRAGRVDLVITPSQVTIIHDGTTTTIARHGRHRIRIGGNGSIEVTSQ